MMNGVSDNDDQSSGNTIRHGDEALNSVLAVKHCASCGYFIQVYGGKLLLLYIVSYSPYYTLIAAEGWQSGRMHWS